FYADHHQAGKIPQDDNLTALIDTNSNTCTSLIINQHLQGKFPLWAITAAFGDNLFDSAQQLANKLNLSLEIQEQLKKLGIYINYNGYGSCLEDLHFTPDKLYQEMVKFASPLGFMSDNAPIFQQLEADYLEDMNHDAQMVVEYSTDKVAVYILKNTAWVRRVSGVFGNDLANQYPDRAHAVLTLTPDNDYQVSVRAPLNNKTKADELCASFSTGGGRKAAAGINHLAKSDLGAFIEQFEQTYHPYTPSNGHCIS
ncbi:MAG: DHH family phosphoesterase, partial [Methylomarinum sp.]|nr:DHH family phosphoesterase [Methylomarinum sp.]